MALIVKKPQTKLFEVFLKFVKREIVAQWLEHCPVTAEVAGSSPVSLVSMLLQKRSFCIRKFLLNRDHDKKVYLILLERFLDKQIKKV